MSTVRLGRTEARRLAVRAQLLDRAPGDAPGDEVDVVRRLGGVQVDLTEAVARSADLVLRARLGSRTAPGAAEALQTNGDLFEFRARLLPAADIALLRADMDVWPGPRMRPWQDEYAGWVDANDGCRREILAVLRSEGPMPARALPDSCVRAWRSSGWTEGKNVMKLLELMELRGEVAVSSREGRERLWDLAERIHDDLPAVPAEEAHREWARRRLRAAGLARPRSLEADVEPYDVRDVGVQVRVEGTRGTWRADPDLLERLGTGEAPCATVVLSPLDRLVLDRKRALELFDFDYQLEMYKPAAKRRWGYWALPLLEGEALIGKVDATADRAAGVLHVDAVHPDVAWTVAREEALWTELSSLARWLGLDLMDGRPADRAGG